jgi:hypothetical protein
LLGGVGVNLSLDPILLGLVDLAHAFALFKGVFESIGHITFEATHFFNGFVESSVTHDAHTGVGQTVRRFLGPSGHAQAKA